MAISKRLRYEILRRDNHTCRYCGRAAPAVALTVDHVLPVTLGGTDDATNLVAACPECNAGKSSSSPDQPLVDQVSEDAIRWARAIAQAAAYMVEDVDLRGRLNREFDALWAENCINTVGREWTRPAGWAEDLDAFRARGLPQPAIIDAFWISFGARVPTGDVWRYMCGICWKRVRQIEEHARALLAVEEAGS